MHAPLVAVVTIEPRGFNVYQINSKPSLRSALLLGAASAAAISLSAPAFAQESTETVVVTGSRIPQTGLYSSSPVTSVGQQEIKLEGTTNVETLLNNLPSNFADFGQAESNGASGTATVDLRDLGDKRTLVLIDGKRLMPGDPTLPVPDLNQVPASLVDHIEVVTGGASAVYGSDAVAGVVNFIMRKDFEGIEFDGQYGVNQHNNNNSYDRSIVAEGLGGSLPGSVAQAPANVLDGADFAGTLIMGANSPNNKGNVTAYVSYQNTQAVLESQRDFSACGSETTGSGKAGFYHGFICAGSSTSALDSAGGAFNVLYNRAVFPPPHPATGPKLTIDGTTGDLRPFEPSDKFNFAPLNYLQRPDTRYNGGVFANYQATPAIDFFGSFMFMDDHTVAQIAPSGLFYGTFFNVNCNNPYLTGQEQTAFCSSAGYGPTDETTLLIGRRLVEAGNRQDDLRHTSYRMVAGAKGDLSNGWNYELFAQFGDTIFAEEYLNDLSLSRINNALNVVNVGGTPTCESVINGTDPNCVPLNIFQPGGVTAAAAKYISVPGFQEGDTQESVVGASLQGDLGAWGVQSPWAKSPVSVVVGTEYRQESLNFRTDLEFSSGDLAGQGGPRIGTNGRYDVAEGFGELKIPLVENMPFFEDLSVHGAYRYSSYNTAGAVNTYSYDGQWQPIDDFKIRASFQRAVRAPNVIELFTDQSLGLFGGTDPCSGPVPAQTAAQCAHSGVTAAQYGSILQLGGGNPSLKPEVSDTREVGVVFTPTFLPGFTSTIDYFNIRVTGAIGVIPEATTLNNCGLTGSAVFCDLIHRNSIGVIFGTGATAGYVTATNVNTGSLQTKGMDFEGNYTSELNDWGLGNNGSISANFLGTWTQHLYVQNIPGNPNTVPGAAIYDCSGLFGLSCGTPVPQWRHKLRVTWSSPWDVDLSLQWRYMSSVKFDGNTTGSTPADQQLQSPCGGPCGDLSDAKIAAYNYIDLGFDWTIRDGVDIHGGVNNVFDKDPPFLDSNGLGIASPPFGNGNTYPQVYDSLGRLFFLGATIKD
jgi:iron complex outermembrane recepter protein